MDVIMPQLGETVAEGTVTKWYKKVGDAVKADDVLFDVETDKVEHRDPGAGERRARGNTRGRGRDRQGGREAGSHPRGFVAAAAPGFGQRNGFSGGADYGARGRRIG